MKKIILVAVWLLTVQYTFPQKWEHTIGQANLDENSRRVIEHYDKGYLITATYTAGYNDVHGWLLKTDINGNPLWNVTLGIDPDQVIIEKTVYDDQGNIYVFGSILREIDIDSPLVLKLNACGELEWCRIFAFPEYDYGYYTDGILLDNGDLLALASMPNANQ